MTIGLKWDCSPDRRGGTGGSRGVAFSLYKEELCTIQEHGYIEGSIRAMADQPVRIINTSSYHKTSNPL